MYLLQTLNGKIFTCCKTMLRVQLIFLPNIKLDAFVSCNYRWTNHALL